ncbi:hypothetical protein [Parachlamydia sp. AcF125]|uniref:hypothetical protein n=1 Tax=Parachlamydia sp. AcF125 TaxID=2795736 RepID=UPI001BC90A23|nr:hypothetical protein [Parachlamydia sp. AcF125]MBS4169150.1 hypothetical protein [Parachlamydia sp. AcF125]
MGVLEPQPPTVSPLAAELYKEIKKRNFRVALSDIKNKNGVDLLRIYGKINISEVDSVLNKKLMENAYKETEKEFEGVFQNYFKPLSRGENLNAAKRTFLGNRSAYGPEACLHTTAAVLRIMCQYLLYQPFPFEEAKCLRLYKIKPLEDISTPYEYAKELKKNYVAKVQWIYKLFGPSAYIVGGKLKEALDRELCEIKCLPFPIEKGSWKTHIMRWAQHEEWGGKISGILPPVTSFMETYHLSCFLPREAKILPFSTKKEFVIEFGSCKIPPELSFKNYIQDATLRDFFRYLCGDLGSLAPVKIYDIFLKEIQTEKKRHTFVYFFTDTVKEYQNIPKQNPGGLDYELFKNVLKNQFKKIKHLTYNYQPAQEKKYSLSENKKKFYELLLVCLLTMHTIQICPEYSPNDRKAILMGIWKMSLEEKRKLYEFLYLQVAQPYEGKPLRNSFTSFETSWLNPFSKLAAGKRVSNPVNHSQTLVESLKIILETLKGYAFSKTQRAKMKIFVACFRKGLIIQNLEANFAGYQAVDLMFCAKIIQDLKEFCGFPLPADVVYNILNWHYLSKKEIREIKELKKKLTETKFQIRDILLATKKFFFISPQITTLIDTTIQAIIPDCPYVDKKPEANRLLSECLRFALYPHISAKDLYPFIFLALNEQKGPIFKDLAKWAKGNCQVLRMLEPSQSALWVNSGWKAQEGNKYFQMSLIFFPSILTPQSFNLEATLFIPKTRLSQDHALNQILRVFSTYLCDEFESLKMEEPECLREEGTWQRIETPKNQDKGREIELESGDAPQEFHLFENLLALSNHSILSSLWESYQAEDKEEIGHLIYNFYYQLKYGVREKMLKISFPEQASLGKVHKIALEGSTFTNSEYLSLVPVDLGGDPKYYICKKDYQVKMESLLEAIKKGESFFWEKGLEINVGERLFVDIGYRFLAAIRPDYKESQALESRCLNGEEVEECGEEEELGIKDTLFALQTLDGSPNKIEESCHELVFTCLSGGVSFKVIYPNLPSLDLLYWQILKLKWKFYQSLIS